LANQTSLKNYIKYLDIYYEHQKSGTLKKREDSHIENQIHKYC